jgi:hypothetical protein
MAKQKNRFGLESEAEFIGWQETSWGKRLALFTITIEEHPSYGSTVCEPTLRAFNLRIPQIPYYEGNIHEFGPLNDEHEMRKE